MKLLDVPDGNSLALRFTTPLNPADDRSETS
jgi:hypothetical protein